MVFAGENNDQLKILFVEDLPSDMELAKFQLNHGGLVFTSQRVDNQDSLIQALDDFRPDLVISDYAMPAFDGMKALRICLQKYPHIPVIMLTGSMNEETAVACLKAGASDYVLKEHMIRLPFAVKEALKQAQSRQLQIESAEALIQSEANLRALLNNSDDRIWSVDTQYRLLTGNAVFMAHAEGATGGKFKIGESIFSSLIFENQVDDWKGYLDRAFRGERVVVEITTKLVEPPAILEYHFSPLTDANGKIIGGVASGRDITHRKGVEKKITEQEEELSAIFENSPILMIVVDSDRRIIKINGMQIGSESNVNSHQIGQRIGEALRCVNALGNPDGCGFSGGCNNCRVRSVILDTLETGESHYQMDITLGISDLDKSHALSLLMSTTKLSIRNQPMVLISMLDITEKKKADLMHLREQSLLRTVIDNIPDRIFFKDTMSRFVIANEGVAKHIGVTSPDELIGKSDFDFYPKEHADEYYRNEQDLLISDEPMLNREEPARDSFGTIGWTMTSKIPVKDNDGNILGLVGISRDISELKKTHEELVLAKNLAEQSNQLKDAFVANISHEIRTPLNSILGFSDLIRDSFEDYRTDETDEYFDIIDQSSQRLMRTVDMILSMSRLQVGETTINPQPCDLDALVKKLIQQYSLAAKKKTLSLQFESAGSDSMIISDEYCVIHAVSNLIDNALKYTKSGHVIIRLAEVSENSIQLEVEDSGIGMSENYRTNLFNPFSQEEPGISRPYEGIGLGLSLAKRLLENIEATITVESQQGIGTTFRIIFPKSLTSTEPYKAKNY